MDGAGIVDHEPDLDIVGAGTEVVEHIRSGQVERQNADLDAGFGLNPLGDVLQERFLSRHQDQIDASLSQLAGESDADALGRTQDQRPRSVFGPVKHDVSSVLRFVGLLLLSIRSILAALRATAGSAARPLRRYAGTADTTISSG